MNDSPIKISTDLMADYLDNQIRKLTREHSLAVDQLSEDQLVAVIRQQIASGDILRHVHFGHCMDGSGDLMKQSIVYTPYAGVERLRTENAELKRKLKAVEEAMK